MGPLVTVFGRDGILMLDTEGKSATTFAIYGDFSVREIDESAAPPPATGAGR